MLVRRSLPILTLQLANTLASSLILPVLPLIAVISFGGTPFQAVGVEAVYHVAKLISTPYLASLSDRYGRRPILLIGQCGTLLAFILFLVAELVANANNVELSGLSINISIWLLYLGRALDGSTGGNSTLARLYITDQIDPDDQSTVLGWLSGMLGIGFVFGPAVGGLISVWYGLLAPIIVGTLLAFFALLLILVVLDESRPQAHRYQSDRPSLKEFSNSIRGYLAHPLYNKLILISFFTPLCFSAISPILVLYVDAEIVQTNNVANVSQFVGIMYAVIGVCMILTQLTLIKPLAKRLGDAGLMFVGVSGVTLAFGVIGLVSAPWSFMIALAMAVVAYAVISPSLQTLIIQAGEQESVGQRLGLFQIVNSSANLVAPIWAGLLFQELFPRAVWAGAVVLLLPACLAAWRLKTRLVMPQTA